MPGCFSCAVARFAEKLLRLVVREFASAGNFDRNHAVEFGVLCLPNASERTDTDLLDEFKVTVSSITRLKPLPQDGHVKSSNVRPSSTSTGFWQCGQRACMVHSAAGLGTVNHSQRNPQISPLQRRWSHHRKNTVVERIGVFVEKPASESVAEVDGGIAFGSDVPVWGELASFPRRAQKRRFEALS